MLLFNVVPDDIALIVQSYHFCQSKSGDIFDAVRKKKKELVKKADLAHTLSRCTNCSSRYHFGLTFSESKKLIYLYYGEDG